MPPHKPLIIEFFICYLAKMKLIIEYFVNQTEISLVEDDEVFENHLIHALSGDLKYISNIINDSYENGIYDSDIIYYNIIDYSTSLKTVMVYDLIMSPSL